MKTKKKLRNITALTLSLLLALTLCVTAFGDSCSGARSLANRARSVSNITPA